MDKICVIGLWHLGLVSAATLADLGRRVVGYDPDAELVSRLGQGILPLFEPGLEELVKTHLKSSRLRFEKDLQTAVAEAKTVLIAYDVPVDDQDRIDLSVVDKTLRSIVPHLSSGSLVIINSQVPVGSCEQWHRVISEGHADRSIDVVYVPENLRLGQAIDLFRRPDMIVIGCNSERAREKAEGFYGPFPVDKLFVSWRTAEMAKHALNAFFATSISFANELGNLCDAVGADGVQIAEILRKDRRIGGKAQVRPGLGFAGATLARDLRSLQKLATAHSIGTPLVDSVLVVNQRQIGQISKMVELYFEGQLRGKDLTVFGLTYKPGTSTLRRSASIEIINLLHAKGAQMRAHDPKADLSELAGKVHFDYYTNPYEASEGSDGILLLTEWPEYRDLDFERIKKRMAHPMILDAKNYLDGVKLRQQGYDYLEIGRGQLATVRSLCE